jgi:hypothetical protein
MSFSQIIISVDVSLYLACSVSMFVSVLHSVTNHGFEGYLPDF